MEKKEKKIYVTPTVHVIQLHQELLVTCSYQTSYPVWEEDPDPENSDIQTYW